MAARAVLFDLGDTLIFRARAPDPDALFSTMADRVRPIFARWHVDPPADLPGLLRELYRAVETAQPERRARGLEVDGSYITRGALSAWGIDVSPDAARAVWEATDVGLAAWGCQTYPDTLDALRRLHALSIATALVSNSWSTASMIAESLGSLGITHDLLPVIVSSADVMRPKPAAEPFERALDALGVAAHQAAFVGDDIDADVRGAKRLGMTTVWKLNGRYETPAVAEADHTIHDLWELFTLDLVPQYPAAPVASESLMPHEDRNADRY